MVRGVTVFELGLATATCGLLGVLGFMFFSPRAEAETMDQALKNAASIHHAALDWRRENPVGCPTVSTLIRDQLLERSNVADDPWGNRFRLQCSSQDITVVSPGKDQRPGTSDDISVPRS